MGELVSGLVINGRYRLQERVGKGGMAEVWRAQQISPGRIVAIKLANLGAIDDSYDRERLAGRFLRECDITGKLQSQHIPVVFDASTYGDFAYFVMEFVDGVTLAEFRRLHHPIELKVIASIVGQICRGLAYAHNGGVFHRDLKPSNLMIDVGGTVKIMDFGIAYAAYATALTTTGGAPGTPCYMPPELFDSGACDERSDIYSLACVIFELATGYRIFPDAQTPAEQMHAHLSRTPTDIRSRRPDIPPDIAFLLARMLAKEPGQRPSSVGDVFAGFQPHLPMPGTPPPVGRYVGDPTATWRRHLPQADPVKLAPAVPPRPRHRSRSGPSFDELHKARRDACDLAKRGETLAAIDLLGSFLNDAAGHYGWRSKPVFELLVDYGDLLQLDGQKGDARHQFHLAREYAIDHPGTANTDLNTVERRIKDLDEDIDGA